MKSGRVGALDINKPAIDKKLIKGFQILSAHRSVEGGL
jgi:hypothetical protein